MLQTADKYIIPVRRVSMLRPRNITAKVERETRKERPARRIAR